MKKNFMKSSWLLLFLLFVVLTLPLSNSLNAKNFSQKEIVVNWSYMGEQDLIKIYGDDLRSMSPEKYKHMQWVAKAARFLRGRKGLTQADDISSLSSMSKEDVVELFLNDDRFYNSIFDFGAYFLGLKVNNIYDSSGEVEPLLRDMYQVMYLVKAYKNDTDFNDFFNLKINLYQQPFGSVQQVVSSIMGQDPLVFEKLSDIEKRVLAFEFILSEIERINNMNRPLGVAGKCEIFENNIYPVITSLGLRGPVSNGILNQASNIPFICDENNMLGDLFFETMLDQTLKDLPVEIEQVSLIAKDFDLSYYKTAQVVDYKKLDSAEYPKKVVYQSSLFNQRLQNSSTNMNRRRGAYTLKRFFCDDLTPVNVEAPDGDSSGAHGSDQSCRACHYKLDPMAGFFKDYGFGFVNFAGEPEIHFDDGAKANLKTYQKQWEDPTGNQKWNIGYVKSVKKLQYNKYGENLEDLHEILKTSTEVKRCFTQRAFEFATDHRQAFDPGFIDYMSKVFSKEVKTSARSALRNLFRSIALSKTFIEEQPVSDQCYDMDPSFDPLKPSPPCQVRHIIKTSCASCHSSVYGSGSLDLSSWEQLPDGSYGFPHLDLAGNQYGAKKTFKDMLDRISSSDPDQRMPANQEMDPVYRQTLYKWLYEQSN